MRCPFCGTLDNKVIDSRLAHGGEATRRRRECSGCQKRYTTYEKVELALPLVVKKDGSKQPFDRNKLMAGLRRACVKRPVTTDTLERALDQLERELSERGEPEVDSSEIGRRVLAALRSIDQVAYVRFASVYRDFKDVHEFMAELSSLLSGNP